MSLYSLSKVAFPGFALALACVLPSATDAQVVQAVSGETSSARWITLDPPTGLDLQAHTVGRNGSSLPEAPPNFRRFGEATVGKQADLRTLTLRFSQTTRITGITISNDFKIEQGGSCVEGNIYEKDTTCRLLVRFTPQGPGNRLGTLNVRHTGSTTPDGFGLNGFGYSPVLSFVPSIITTVPGTYPSGKGLLLAAPNLAIGGDTLYVADVGNSLLRKIDSSGTITNTTPFFANPISIAVDTFGIVWGLSPSGSSYYFLFFEPWSTQGADSATYHASTCTPSAPCSLASVGMSNPAEMSIDINNNLFMEEATQGALEMPVTGYSGGNGTLNLWHLLDQYAYFTGTPSTFAVNPYSDDLFTALSYSFENTCYIIDEPLYGAEIGNPTSIRVAGGSVCGYSGDGGLGTNAEIGSAIGQMAFDAAGDLYFTDTNNQRVRRVDFNTGIIRTIAGTGTAGYTGDGGQATSAELSNPIGVAVDSQGQVYIISNATSGPSGQVIRQITATGFRGLGAVVKGTKSPPGIVTLTNTGNSNFQLTSHLFTGPNPTEFAVDNTTTSCTLTAGATLSSGQTCQIGFTCTPAAKGERKANFVLLDNTANSSNTIELACNGILPSATFKITSPANNASFTSGTAVTFKVSVTSASGPAPTGTVQFKVDGTNYGSPWTVSSGSASTSVGGLSTGSHTLSATYSGDSNYAAGGPISVTIKVTSTTTIHQPTVTMSPMAKANMSCVPQAFNVNVSSTSGVVPTGTVHLLDGSHTESTATLVNGKAVLNSPPLTAGTHSFTTEYGGDAHNRAASSAAIVEMISQSGRCSQPIDLVAVQMEPDR